MPKKILVIEDNELNMKLFHDLLKSQGHDVIKDYTGIDAVELTKEHKPDLIMMDIQLPDVSGLDVIRWIKGDAEIKDIPIIAVTAFAMKGDEERIMEAGCNGYISKPISISSFLSTISTYL